MNIPRIKLEEYSFENWLHFLDKIGELHGDKGARRIGHSIGQNQTPGMKERSATIDYVWYVAFAFGFVRTQQWVVQAGDDARRIFQIQ